MSEPITTSTDVINGAIDEIERLERRVAELESKLYAAHDLPRITDEIWEDFKDTGLLNFDDEPGPTCGEVTWSQLAHDFACLLSEKVGDNQCTTNPVVDQNQPNVNDKG